MAKQLIVRALPVHPQCLSRRSWQTRSQEQHRIPTKKTTPLSHLLPPPTPATHRDAARILGGLTLLVVEVSGHGDHGGCARLAQGLFRYSLELDKHHCRDLLGRHLLLRPQPGDLHLGAAVAAVHHSERERLGVVADDLWIGFGILAFCSIKKRRWCAEKQ